MATASEPALISTGTWAGGAACGTLALAAAKGLVCLPGHNYIYESGMVRTRELVEGGDLGKIVSAYVMYNIHHPEEVAKRYPGVVRQILTHHSYILLYLVGNQLVLLV